MTEPITPPRAAASMDGDARMPASEFGGDDRPRTDVESRHTARLRAARATADVGVLAPASEARG